MPAPNPYIIYAEEAILRFENREALKLYLLSIHIKIDDVLKSEEIKKEGNGFFYYKKDNVSIKAWIGNEKELIKKGININKYLDAISSKNKMLSKNKEVKKEEHKKGEPLMRRHWEPIHPAY